MPGARAAQHWLAAVMCYLSFSQELTAHDYTCLEQPGRQVFAGRPGGPGGLLVIRPRWRGRLHLASAADRRRWQSWQRIHSSGFFKRKDVAGCSTGGARVRQQRPRARAGAAAAATRQRHSHRPTLPRALCCLPRAVRADRKHAGFPDSGGRLPAHLPARCLHARGFPMRWNAEFTSEKKGASEHQPQRALLWGRSAERSIWQRRAAALHTPARLPLVREGSPGMSSAAASCDVHHNTAASYRGVSAARGRAEEEGRLTSSR